MMNHSDDDDDQSQYSVDDILLSVLKTKSKLDGQLGFRRRTNSRSKENTDSSSSLNVLGHDESKNLTSRTVTNSTLFNNRNDSQDRYSSNSQLFKAHNVSQSTPSITRTTSTPELNFKFSSNNSVSKSKAHRQIFIDEVKDSLGLLKRSQKPLEEVSVVDSKRKCDIQPEKQHEKTVYQSDYVNDSLRRRENLTTRMLTNDVGKNDIKNSAICSSLESKETKLLIESSESNKNWTNFSVNRNINGIHNKPHLSNPFPNKLKEEPASYIRTVNKPAENKDLKSVGTNFEKYNKNPDKENIPLNSKEEKEEAPHVFSKPSARPKSASISLEIGNSDLIIVNSQNYLKMGELGKGGSSIVYEVLDMQSKQRKAIKLVTLDKEDEVTRLSYKNEIKILQRLYHSPRIINLFDYEESPSALKLVMEAGNVDLAGILKTVRENNKPIPAFSIKHYWQEMLQAVQVIHNEGIIHSDLKPANFLQVNGTLKLIDFGIASSIQKDMTSVFKDNQCGTFNFMSPESLNDISNGPILGNKPTDKLTIKISVKSDVWSLGCILYNLVYGKTPFQHISNLYKKLMAIANPNTIINFPPLTDKDLLDVLQKCLQYNPYKRPSIADLLSHPYLDGSVSPQVSRKGVT